MQEIWASITERSESSKKAGDWKGMYVKDVGDQHHIRREFSLGNIGNESSEVTGVTSLTRVDHIKEKDIINSIGEFAGYFSTDTEIVLFRDRIGARNIYYSIDGDTAYVATDLRWIAQKVKATPNYNYIRTDYLQFQLPFSNETFYSGVYKVMPGTLLHLTKNGITEKQYWSIQFGESAFNSSDLQDLIIEAVKIRLSFIEGSPYTAYLSGGLDSSTIALLAKPELCYSGFYEEEGYSETDYITTVLEHAELPKHFNTVKITESAFYENLDNLHHILPDPSCGLGVIPQVIVAKDAAQKFQYAFTGEGGDEIFLGYNWNTAILTLAAAAKTMLRDRYMVRYEGMVEKILSDGFATFAGGLLNRGDDLLYSTKRILEIWDKNDDVENNLLRINLQIGLPAILSVDERVGYHSGVMPISPLMDHRIVEYVCSRQPGQRAPIPKHMLREATKSILPEKVRMRYDKMGFPVPYKTWQWPMLNEYIMGLKERGVIELDHNDARTMDRRNWALFSVESFLRNYSKYSADAHQ